MLLLSLLSVLLISIPFASSFQVVNFDSVQDYYYRLILKGASCGTISKIELLQQGKWRENNQLYYESDGSPSYGWDYTGVKFGDMLPISIKITATGRNPQTFSGIIKNLDAGAVFTSSGTACGGTLDPTKATKNPTPAPTPSPTKPTTPYPTSEKICLSKTKIDWTVGNNQIYLNGNRFNLKGLSWFGFETPNGGLYGLDKHNEDWYLKWMTDRGFNAIRLPFSADFINGGGLDKYCDFVEKAATYGVFIMLDMHSKTTGSWRDGLYTIDKDEAIATWRKVAKELVSRKVWNVMFVDVFNEPHDVQNSQWSEWVQFCEDVGAAVWDEGLKALIAVEGTNSNCPVIPCCWGENLIGAANDVFDLDVNKFVWSPHVYGVDVTGNPNYSPAGWYAHWGYLVGTTTLGTKAPIVIGEFGTKYTGGMVNWLNSLVNYLIKLDQRNHFFWCLNPNSGDTGGLLKSDWTSPETAKLAQLDKLQPNPSVVTVNTNTICVSGLGSGSGSSGTTKYPTPSPTTKSSGTTSSGGGSSGKCTIKQNGGNGNWWQAFEIKNCPSGVSVTNVEYGDNNNYKNTWLEAADKKAWGGNWWVYRPTNGIFKGTQKFRVTTNKGKTTTSNVFTGPGDTRSRTLTVASSFTEDDGTVGNSGLTWPGIAAIIVVGLLCIACCIIAAIYYKKRKAHQGKASFQDTQVETPKDTPTEAPPTQTTTTNDNEDEDAEIEVEMNVAHQTVTATQD